MTPRRVGLVTAVLVGILVCWACAAWAYGRHYRDRVLPGVTAAGTPLGGLDAAAAEAVLAEQRPTTVGEITLRDPADGRTWRYPTDALGLSLDARSLAEAAVQAGRTGGPIARLLGPLVVRWVGRDILADPPFDEARARATLQALAPKVDVAPVDAALELVEGKVVEREPVFGRQLDLEGTLAKLPGLARNADTAVVELVVAATAPRVYDISSVADAFERVTSSPLTLNVEGQPQAIIPVEELARWAVLTSTLSAEGDVLPAISFDRAPILRRLVDLAGTVDRPPSSARFRYDQNGGRVSVLEPQTTGYRLDIDASVQRVIDGAYLAQRVAELVVEATLPPVTNEALETFAQGVEPLGIAYTGFGGAPEGRLKNMLVAVGRLDGVAVAAGGTFSLNASLGVPTAAAGFEMAQITAGATDADALYGGGLEQVATTAFRAAVWGGFPIAERHAPPSRVPWFEPPIGLDAAFGPGHDLRFTNDSADPIFVSVTLDTARSALAWAIIGRPRSRRVEIAGPIVTAVEPAASGPITRRTDDVPRGVSEQAAWAREGADVVVERVVTEAGVEIARDTFASDYAPAADVVLVGTGAQ